MTRQSSDDTVSARLRDLEALDHAALRSEWRRLYRVEPPKRVSRELLALGVGWKIQERARGGFDAAIRRRLADLARTLERDGDVTRNRVLRLRPGARLVREWHGENHAVVVREEGFEWRGRLWRSLSAIACEITGTRWSGPRFFGMTAGATVERAAAESGDG